MSARRAPEPYVPLCTADASREADGWEITVMLGRETLDVVPLGTADFPPASARRQLAERGYVPYPPDVANPTLLGGWQHTEYGYTLRVIDETDKRPTP